VPRARLKSRHGHELDVPLTRVLSPQGARLITLRDAGAYLSERFAGVTHSAVLEHAIELLMKAAQSGTLADRKTETDQVARTLQGQRLV
jgi:hypothetical protein